MFDVAFYAVMPCDRKSKGASKAFPLPWTRANLKNMGHEIECFALYTSKINGRTWRYNPGGAALVLENDRNSVAYTGVSLEWLSERCIRISESMARELHPEIVDYMESDARA